eukprot:gene5864-11840_t
MAGLLLTGGRLTASSDIKCCCAATWRFGSIGVHQSSNYLLQGKSSLDSIELGISAVENFDEEFTFVGKGGLPNAIGELELDAAIMNHNRRYGAVISVMEKCVHNILSGDGALSWALANGFTREPHIMNEASIMEWDKWKATNSASPTTDELISSTSRHSDESHDTIGMICLDKNGHLCAGTSTSGWKFKHPGRVGDSPLVGGGLYCDGLVGAAVATGDGEEIMRTCLSFLVVEYMRMGQTPQEACKTGIQRMIELCGRDTVFGGGGTSGDRQHPLLTVGVIAMSPSGQVGAASTLHEGNLHRGSAGFPVACWREDMASDSHFVLEASLEEFDDATKLIQQIDRDISRRYSYVKAITPCHDPMSDFPPSTFPGDIDTAKLDR